MSIYVSSIICFFIGFTFAYITRLIFGGFYKIFNTWG